MPMRSVKFCYVLCGLPVDW